MTTIKLKSFDGVIFEVDLQIAMRFGIISEMIENLGIDKDDKEVVELPNVYSAILKKIIEWATYHKDDPPAPPEEASVEQRSDDIPPWDVEFLNTNQGELNDLLIAANYLNIQPLMTNICKTIANMIKGKSTEDIRKVFNIENDFTPAEMEQIKKNNNWIDEK